MRFTGVCVIEGELQVKCAREGELEHDKVSNKDVSESE